MGLQPSPTEMGNLGGSKVLELPAVSCAKMAELIKMPFGTWTWGTHRTILDGVQIPHMNGQFSEGK